MLKMANIICRVFAQWVKTNCVGETKLIKKVALSLMVVAPVFLAGCTYSGVGSDGFDLITFLKKPIVMLAIGAIVIVFYFKSKK